MIGIVDYGMGNLLSVFNAVEYIGTEAKICEFPHELDVVERIILPGVGAFRNCMDNLKTKGFAEALNRNVIEQKKPIFGICLGMQIMGRKSYEGGEHEGLGWFDADVVRIKPDDPYLRVPQIGWNEISYQSDCDLFKGLPENPHFYLVHSYYVKCKNSDDIVAKCDYGGEVTAAIRKENIFATQFHPEKSQEFGLQMLENFMAWDP